MKDYGNLQFLGLRDYIKNTDEYRIMGLIEVSLSIACSLSYWNELASLKKVEEKLICIDGICDNKSCTLPKLNT